MPAPTTAFASSAPLTARHAVALRPDLCSLSPKPSSPPTGVRAALATPPTETRFVGKAPVARRGRLRADLRARYADPASVVATPPLTADTYRWSAGGYNQVTRSAAIWGFAAQMIARNWADSRRFSYLFFNKTDEKSTERRRRLAAWAREQILNLGPTMIKVGQLAARPDLFPPEVVDELVQLSDSVPAFGWDMAEGILRREYGGREPGDVFEFVDKVPLAAASLGQVHRARLRTGEDVVVKIQRPGLEKLFDLDLEALRIVVEYLQRSKKYGGETRDWVAIYKECKKTLYLEIDYEIEGRNAERFASNFKDIDWVKVPKIYWEYSTKEVLCMQYLPGINVRDKEAMLRAGSIDPKLVADRCGELLLRQILDHAFFNCDPHSGNFAISANSTLCIYDFGMVGELSPNIKARLVDLLVAVIDKDAQAVVDILVDLKALVLPADPLPVKRSIQFFLDSIGNRPDREQTVAAIGDDLYATSYDQPFRLPAESIFLLRALSTVEGVNNYLNPDFSYAEIAKPFADEILKGRGREGFGGPTSSGGAGEIIRSVASAALTGKPNLISTQLQKRISNASSSALQASGRIQKIESTLSKIENGDLKLRSRSQETERMLRKQFDQSQATNQLLVSGFLGIAAAQVYGQGLVEGAAVLSSMTAVSALLYVRKSTLVSKDKFKSRK